MNKDKFPRYAFAYARVSDPRQAQKDVSIPEQFKEIGAYAGRENIVILRDFADRGRSAYRDDVKREEFEEMIHLAKEEPRVSLILVHESSRFVRRRAKAVMIKAELNQHGVKVIPVLNPYDSSTIAGFWMESIDETRAEAESMATSMHTLEKMKGSIGQRDPETGWCFKNGGRAPAGYKNVRVVRGIDHRGREIVRLLWEIDEEWGNRIQQIIRELKLEKNLSYDKIRDECNIKGWLSPEGRPITTSFIRELFREDRLLQLAGYAFWNREDRKTKGRRFKPREEWIKVPNAHPALITEEEVIQCRALIEGRNFNDKNIPQEESRFLLTGKNFFICKRCGGNTIGDTRGGRHKLKYCCSTIVYEGSYTNRCIPGVKLPKELIEEYVISEIQKRFGTQERIRELVRKVNALIREENKDFQTGVMFLDKQIKNLNSQINNLVAAIAKGTPPEFVNPEIEKLKQELVKAESQKNGMQAVKPAIKTVDEEKVIAKLCQLDEVMRTGTNREKRQFIRYFVRSLEFDPIKKQIKVFWYHDPLKKTLDDGLRKCVGFGTSPASDTRKFNSVKGFRGGINLAGHDAKSANRVGLIKLLSPTRFI
jgi:site-specific DNA recombinase